MIERYSLTRFGVTAHLEERGEVWENWKAIAATLDPDKWDAHLQKGYAPIEERHSREIQKFVDQVRHSDGTIVYGGTTHRISDRVREKIISSYTNEKPAPSEQNIIYQAVDSSGVKYSQRENIMQRLGQPVNRLREMIASPDRTGSVYYEDLNNAFGEGRVMNTRVIPGNFGYKECASVDFVDEEGRIRSTEVPLEFIDKYYKIKHNATLLSRFKLVNKVIYNMRNAVSYLRGSFLSVFRTPKSLSDFR